MLFNFVRVASAVLLVSSSSLLASAAPTVFPDVHALLAEDNTLSHLEKRAAASVITACKDPKMVAITFDDGPSQYTDALLNDLKKRNVKVTFFVNGDNGSKLESDPKKKNALVRAYKEGHQIASHTWSHQSLAKLKTEEIAAEMTKLDDVLFKLIKKRPLYMRPPYGETSPAALEYLGKNGYKVINWNVDTNDWQHHDTNKGVQQSLNEYKAAIKKKASQNKGDGFIALQHDTYKSTATQLGKAAVDWVISRGYKVVPVGTCLGDKKWYR